MTTLNKNRTQVNPNHGRIAHLVDCLVSFSVDITAFHCFPHWRHMQQKLGKQSFHCSYTNPKQNCTHFSHERHLFCIHKRKTIPLLHINTYSDSEKKYQKFTNKWVICFDQLIHCFVCFVCLWSKWVHHPVMVKLGTVK